MASIQLPRSTTSGAATSKLEALKALAGRTGAVATMNRIDQTLMVLGIVLIPLGFFVIILGWYGASKTPYSFEQMPYLISGGILGLGLMFVGSILYLASWVSRLAGQDRDEAQKARDILAAMQVDLHGIPAAIGGDGAAASTNGAVSGLVATPTGSMFHRPDCTVVSDRDDLRQVSATADKMRPCKMCDPLHV